MRGFNKIIAIASLTFAFAAPTLNSYGHGACNTFFGAKCDGAPRWSSEARLFSFGIPQAIQVTGYQCYPYLYAASVSRSWGYQWTKYTAGVGCQRTGWVKRRWQARGNEFSPLVSEFIGAMMEGSAQAAAADTPNVETSEVIEKAVEWNEQAGTVTVIGINANCKVWIGEPVQSVIRYEIWQRDSENDQEFREDKVIYSTSIAVRGASDVVSGNGPLLGIPYSVAQDNGYRILKIQDASVTLPIPADAKLDLLAIQLVSDGGGDETAIMAQSLISSDLKLTTDNFGLNVFPNPANGFINVSLQSPSEGTAQIKMYDAMGRLANITIPSQSLQAGVPANLRVDARELSAGNYYIVVQTEGAKYVKQVTIMK